MGSNEVPVGRRLISERQWQELERLLEPGRVQSGCAAPASLDEVAAVVRWAAANQVQVLPGATGDESAIGLDLSGLRRQRFYDPADLTLGCDAGVTAGEVMEWLAAAQQFLPLDVGQPALSLGAILGGHHSGPLRHFFGTVRDAAIGIECVATDGGIVHGGGRVVKNVAGYDLMKLFIGSRGSLGVITGVNFKVSPWPRETETVRLRPADLDAVERVRHWVLHAPLRFLCCELRSDGIAWEVWLRYAGSQRVRERYRTEIATLLPAELLDEAVWSTTLAQATGSRFDISVPASAATRVLAALPVGNTASLAGRLGLGVFAIQTQTELSDAEIETWRAVVAEARGFLSVRDARAMPATVRFGAPTHDYELMRRVKRELDSQAVFPDPWGLT
ncbi:MAG: FAD-binding oxidoreductase [Terriglobales bacterium]